MIDVYKNLDILEARRKKSIVIFGGSTLERDSQMYATVFKVANTLASSEFSIVTGGSDGVMEAASRGAFEANEDRSMCIHALDDEEFNDKYVSSGLSIAVKDGFERLRIFVDTFDVFIFFPGGFGTLQELASVLIRQTTHNKKIFLFGESFWRSLKSWMTDVVLYRGYVGNDVINNVCILQSSDELYKALKIDIN
ncbi:MAG: LOG family protein [Chlamydiia bacterium]|nr:LOG family protein [Chlamydiia bacterium]